jgi:FkbM family methyltransferase
MIARFVDVAAKGWRYSLAVLAEPARMPFLAWNSAARKAHLGELLKLNEHRKWLQAANIRTVVDVGANAGQFSSAIRCLVPEAQIYAFEPLPDCYEALCRRLAKQGRFQGFCTAVGSESGDVTFWRSEFTKSSSVLPMTELHKEAFPWSKGAKEFKVPQCRLDDCLDKMQLAPNVLLKIDVQGYELEVLLGAPRLLQRVNYALVETSFHKLYQGQALFHQVYERMRGEGFVYAGNFEQLLSPLDGAILQADSLFVRQL